MNQLKYEYDSISTIHALVSLLWSTALRYFPVFICIACMGFINQLKDTTKASYDSRYLTEWLIRKLYCSVQDNPVMDVTREELSVIINLVIQFLMYT